MINSNKKTHNMASEKYGFIIYHLHMRINNLYQDEELCQM